MSTQPSSGAPVLIAPREAAVVDGKNVRFEWDAEGEADGYILQVAESARFDAIVLEEETGTHTAVRVADFFPTNEETFFWRILTIKGEAITTGDRVESFVAADAETARAYGGLPEKEEGMGPAVELVRSTKEEIPERVVSPEAQFEREREVGVAEEGVAAGQIAGIAVAIIVVITIAVFVLFAWTSVEQQQARQAAVATQSSVAEQTNTEGRRQISGYEVVDEEEGRYRIPIDRAIDIIVEEHAQEQNGEDG